MANLETLKELMEGNKKRKGLFSDLNVGAQTERLKKALENPKQKDERAPEEIHELEEEPEREEEINGDYLGKPIVTVRRVLDRKAIIAGDEIPTALVKHEDKDIIVGIDPICLDPKKVKEGDMAVYLEDSALIVSIVDGITPIRNIPKVCFDYSEQAMNDPTIEVVGGLEREIEELKECMEVFDQAKRKAMIKTGVQPTKGILLYGPSGTGKTMLAKACANYVSASFFNVHTPELFKRHLGETVEEIKRIFIAARRSAPSVLYFDEITRLGALRTYGEGGAEREVAGATEEFQAQMDGLCSNNNSECTLIMASTNLENAFDPAILGRFDIHINIPLPDFDAKVKIVETKINRACKDPKLTAYEIAKRIDKINQRASGRHIEHISNYAKRVALKSGKPLDMGHFEKALDLYSKRIDVWLAKK